jgi:hypothetical protein
MGTNRGDLTGNLLDIPARTMPIDVGSEYEIMAGDETLHHYKSSMDK